MTRTLRNVSDLIDAGLAPRAQRAALERVAARYAVALTPAMAELIDRDDPDDPIARQFIPDPAELETRPEERADPIGDVRTVRLKGSCTATPTACCSSSCTSARSIAASVSGARWSARAADSCRAAALDAAPCLYPRA